MNSCSEAHWPTRSIVRCCCFKVTRLNMMVWSDPDERPNYCSEARGDKNGTPGEFKVC